MSQTIEIMREHNPRYSTGKALEIGQKYRDIEGLHHKFKYMSECEGVELVIKDKRFWFEYYGKQITSPDFYIGTRIKSLLVNFKI